jgi:hypothetical protein
MTDSVLASLAAKGPSPAPILIGMVVSGCIGLAIGKGKGRAGLGFVLGAFLGLIGWIIVGVMKPANAAPAAIAGAPFCSTCGQPGMWAQTYWSCARCQRPIQTAQPSPPSYPQSPACRTCSGPGRWIAESNGWGCDRCKQMIAPAQPTAPHVGPSPN